MAGSSAGASATGGRSTGRQWTIALGSIAGAFLALVALAGVAGPSSGQAVSAATEPLATGGGCNPNYSGCVPDDPVDVDCAGGSGNGPSYVAGPVQVIGSDVYGLDADGDGVGCEDG